MIISIGEYDIDGLETGDVQDGYFDDLDVAKDHNNLLTLFSKDYLNYNVLPQKMKTKWTEQEVVEFLTDNVGKEIIKSKDDGTLIYDGLIVILSCH